MRISKLTYLAFYLNGAQGTGKYTSITMHDVRARIEEGTILDYLKEKLGHDVDLSHFEPLERLEIMMEWNDMLCISAGRKFCVDEGGLCLLVAFLLEGIQRRASELGRIIPTNQECPPFPTDQSDE